MIWALSESAAELVVHLILILYMKHFSLWISYLIFKENINSLLIAESLGVPAGAQSLIISKPGNEL